MSLQRPVFQEGGWMCLNRVPLAFTPLEFPNFAAPGNGNVGGHLGILVNPKRKPLVLLPGPAFLPCPAGLDESIFAKTPFGWQH